MYYSFHINNDMIDQLKISVMAYGKCHNAYIIFSTKTLCLVLPQYDYQQVIRDDLKWSVFILSDSFIKYMHIDISLSLSTIKTIDEHYVRQETFFVYLNPLVVAFVNIARTSDKVIDNFISLRCDACIRKND